MNSVQDIFISSKYLSCSRRITLTSFAGIALYVWQREIKKQLCPCDIYGHLCLHLWDNLSYGCINLYLIFKTSFWSLTVFLTEYSARTLAQLYSTERVCTFLEPVGCSSHHSSLLWAQFKSSMLNEISSGNNKRKNGPLCVLPSGVGMPSWSQIAKQFLANLAFISCLAHCIFCSIWEHGTAFIHVPFLITRRTEEFSTTLHTPRTMEKVKASTEWQE